MPKGPQGQKRPADVVGNAILIGRIATGEAADDPPVGQDDSSPKTGQKGGDARAKAMTPERRSEIARKAAAKRWTKN
jgi:hypothetical protein